MEAPFPGGLASLDFSAAGRLAVLDERGRRLGLPEIVEVDPPAFRCRFHGENVALLGADGLLRTLRPDGSPIGEMRLPVAATDLAVLASGSVLIGHQSGLVRLSESPLRHATPWPVRAIAVESGAVWVLGDARALRLRPVATGYEPTDELELPAPARAASIGPDGALYAVLEPGDRLVSASGGDETLPAPAADLARCGARLWICGPQGLFDVTGLLVPRPTDDGPRFDLPSCES
jgi:hypothetical protein